ncbi:histidine phosphatase family protein [Streptomyces sp. NPDC001933]|uniref:histidine phosphatase family protein n=1 Tax=Streptomyces sp. NPDC001933 TaxID=3364626 RepID=UPI00367F37AA
MGELISIRHGQTSWSLSGQHAGRTDILLTDAGEAAAKSLAPRLARRRLAAVFSSRVARSASRRGGTPVPWGVTDGP